MTTDEAKELRRLRDENGRLRRMVADSSEPHSALNWLPPAQYASQWSGATIQRPTYKSRKRGSTSRVCESFPKGQKGQEELR